MTTATEIEVRLAPIVGLPLWGMNRACTLQSFQFGPRRFVTEGYGPRAGTQKEVGSHALHVQCAWQVYGPAAVWVGSRDRYVIVDGGTDWDRAGANRCDVRVREFIASACPILVVGVGADASGNVRIRLEHDHCIEVCTEGAIEGEQWRFLCPYESREHVVFADGGFREE